MPRKKKEEPNEQLYCSFCARTELEIVALKGQVCPRCKSNHWVNTATIDWIKYELLRIQEKATKQKAAAESTIKKLGKLFKHPLIKEYPKVCQICGKCGKWWIATTSESMDSIPRVYQRCYCGERH